MKNTFGSLFSVTTFGESHGPGLGAVIDGCPAGVEFDEELLQKNLQRRRPGFTQVVSQRKEEDVPEILSGVFNGKTLGTPIAMIVRNRDARSEDYDSISKEPRVGHADDVWKTKFGHVDHRGGGRSSGRETVARVMAGSVAEMFLKNVLPEYSVVAYSTKIGPISLDKKVEGLKKDDVDQFIARLPDTVQSKEVESLLLKAKEEGQSYGGQLRLCISGIPSGLGQPVFHKLKADLASAMMGIGATSAVEVGSGQGASETEGTEFHHEKQSGYGGIRGGISTGEDIELKLSFKPTASVLDISKKGRHDPCIVPRAIPVVEAMACLVMAEHILWKRLDRP